MATHREPPGAPEGAFPATQDEAQELWEALGANRDANWELARRLRQADYDGTLTDEQLEVAQCLVSTLILDMLFVLGGLGSQIVQALEDPEPVNWRVAAATWRALSDDDRIYLERHLTGRWHFIDDFDDEPAGPTLGARLGDLPEGPAKNWPDPRPLDERAKASAA